MKLNLQFKDSLLKTSKGFIYGFIKGHVRECSIHIGIHFGNEFHLVKIGGNLGSSLILP